MVGTRVRHPERHRGDQRSQVLVVVVGRVIDSPHARELTQPEVALLAGGAQKEVSATELFVEHTRRGTGQAEAINGSKTLRLLQHFEMKGIVDVDHHDIGGRAHGRVLRHEVALEHDDVGSFHQVGQVHRIGEAG